MTSYVTPKKNAAFITYVALEDQANAGKFKATPTLAAGDFKVSIDGGALANLATLPTNTPASSTMVKISLSADEMNGDNITVLCIDAAGAEWYDLALNIQTSARQVDDLATPTNITAGTITTVTNLTNAPTSGDLTATMKASVTAAVPAVAAIADGVLDEAMAGHATAGTLGATVTGTATLVTSISTAVDTEIAAILADTPANVWAYPTRTLTQSSTSTTDSTAAGSIARRRGDSWSISLTIGAITGYTSLWFTAKWDRDNTDAQSVIQIKKNASGSGDGLLYVNGATATNAALATITVTDATTGAIVIAVDETVTDDLPPAGIPYDVQALISGSVSTLDSGTLTISADVTRAVA